MSITNTAYVPATYNTGTNRGDYFSETFKVTMDGNPLILTTATISICIRDSKSILLHKSYNGHGITITTKLVTNDAFIWSIEKEDSALFTPGVYFYDIEITYNTKPRTYIKGTFTVLKDQTYE
jgi:hypothetical protein